MGRCRAQVGDEAARHFLIALNLLDLRASALQAERQVNRAAYAFIRCAYLQRRRYLVYDGNPPPAKEEEA